MAATLMRHGGIGGVAERRALVAGIGACPSDMPILRRLNIDRAAWSGAMTPHGNVFGRAMGRINHLRLHAATLGQSWVRGLRQAERIYAR